MGVFVDKDGMSTEPCPRLSGGHWPFSMHFSKMADQNINNANQIHYEKMADQLIFCSVLKLK